MRELNYGVSFNCVVFTEKGREAICGGEEDWLTIDIASDLKHRLYNKLKRDVPGCYIDEDHYYVGCSCDVSEGSIVAVALMLSESGPHPIAVIFTKTEVADVI